MSGESYRIRDWLRQGWRDFRATAGISMAFSGLFTLVGMTTIWTLTAKGYGLLVYPFLTGFMVLAPVLLTGYQRAGRLLREGHQPTLRDLALGITEGTPGIWFLTFVLCLCYLIWVTDALVIYGMYFDFRLVLLDSSVFTDPQLREQLLSYLLFSGVMGLFIALMSFAVSAFSIPLIMHRRLHFVSAVHASVAMVFRHFWLMLRWGLCLSLLILATLILALPLLVVLLPVVAYASYAAFTALFPEPV